MNEVSGGASGDARIARNASTAYALRIVMGLSVLLLTPYLFRELGPGGFGTWSVIFTVAMVFDLIEVGFSAGVIKRAAESLGRADRVPLSATVGFGVVIMAALGLFGAMCCALLALLGDGLAASGERHDFQVGMLALGGAVLLRFCGAAYGAALIGYQRYDLYNLTRLATTAGFAVAAVVAVEAGGGVLGVAAVYASSLALDGLIFGLLLRRLDPALRMRPRLSDPESRRGVLALSSFGLLAESMNYVGQRMDTVVIAAIRSAAAAAPFAAALKLQSALQSLTLPFVNLLMPLVSELSSAGRREAVVQRFTLTSRLALQITLPVAAGLALFAEDLVEVWLGSDAPGVTVTIVVILMVVQTITLAATPAERVLVGLGRVRGIAALVTLEGLSNIALSIVLVSEHGAVGAAFGTLFTTALLAPLRIPIACRAVGISAARFVRTTVLPAIAGTLPALALMAGAYLLVPEGAGRLLAGLSLGVAAAAAVGVVQAGPRRIRSGLDAIRAGAGGQPVTEPTG